MMPRNYCLAASVLVMVALVLPQTSAAQDLQYSSTTKLELAGTAGRVMNVVSRLGGGSEETKETVYLKEDRMRTDDEGSSTILDLRQQRYVILNHDQKTYAVMAFSEMAQMAEQMAAATEDAVDEARSEAGQQTEEHPGAEGDSATMEYDLKVERTGESKTIRGHRAERVLMVMTAKGTQVAEQEGEEDVEGSLVLANEMWVTTDSNGEMAPLFAFQEQMAESMAASFEGIGTSAQAMGDGLQAAFASDPRMGEMMKDAAEEMSELDGFPLITMMKMVMVPGDLEFDAKTAFEGEPEKKEEVSATQRAGRMARSFARSRFGRGSKDDAEKEEAPAEPTQTTLMTVTTEITDVQRSSLSEDLFSIPSDYAERTLTTMHE